MGPLWELKARSAVPSGLHVAPARRLRSTVLAMALRIVGWAGLELRGRSGRRGQPWQAAASAVAGVQESAGRAVPQVCNGAGSAGRVGSPLGEGGQLAPSFLSAHLFAWQPTSTGMQQ